jgi:hypothetical protein
MNLRFYFLHNEVTYGRLRLNFVYLGLFLWCVVIIIKVYGIKDESNPTV